MDAQKMEVPKKNIGVIILNWNGEKLLKRFLENIFRESKEFSDVILVDNASEDHSVDYVKNNFPDIKIIQLDKNYGYAKGYNIAIKKINYEFIVLLNSDVKVTSNWLFKPISFLKKNNNYAACQPKIKDINNNEKFEYSGANGGFIDIFGYPFCRGRIFDNIEIDKKQYDNNIDIFWASGTALFIKRKIFIEIGGFDESFFAHQEEIDLCWRLINNNYKISSIPDSLVYHLGGGTLNKIKPRKTFLNFRNNLKMMFKNLPFYLLPILILRNIIDLIAILNYIAKFKFMHAFSIIFGYISFYMSIPKLLFDKIFLNKNNYKLDRIYKRSIVLDYFILNKKEFRLLDKNKLN